LRPTVSIVDGITIEMGQPGSFSTAAQLSLMALRAKAYSLLGIESEDEAMRYLGFLWMESNNLFSYKYSYVAKVAAAAPVALISCIPGNEVKKAAMATVLKSARAGGIKNMLHAFKPFGDLAKQILDIECSRDEMIVYTLAVMPDYRSQRIGGILLSYAETQAKLLGFSKISILCDDAKPYFSRFGYESECQCTMSKSI